MRIAKLLVILYSSWCWAQNGLTSDAGQASSPRSGTTITVPAGTKLLLALKSTVNTKTAHPGDGVYLETTFPVALDNRIVIPAGTYVQGVIDNVKRPGRVKGRAEVLFHFNSLIFPNGYTVAVPGALQDAPDLDNGRVKDKEGTVQAQGTKGRDVGTVAQPTATGALIGAAAARSGKGAAIGGLAGAGVGLAQVLLTRGDDVRIAQGTSVEMVFQRPLQLEERRLNASRNTDYVPTSQNRRLEKPALTPGPEPR